MIPPLLQSKSWTTGGYFPYHTTRYPPAEAYCHSSGTKQTRKPLEFVPCPSPALNRIALRNRPRYAFRVTPRETTPPHRRKWASFTSGARPHVHVFELGYVDANPGCIMCQSAHWSSSHPLAEIAKNRMSQNGFRDFGLLKLDFGRVGSTITRCASRRKKKTA